jgi:hypothetical protein
MARQRPASGRWGTKDCAHDTNLPSPPRNLNLVSLSAPKRQNVLFVYLAIGTPSPPPKFLPEKFR